MIKYPDVTFAHAGLNVSDVNAVTGWYVENLGLKVVRGVPGEVAFLADPTGRVVLELTGNANVPVIDFSGIHFISLHMAFLVEDPEAWAEKLVSAGAKISDPFRITPSGDRMVMLSDPYGISIQFIKRKEPMF